jgi:cytochrome c oxidase assembly factor CtaG
VTAALVVPLTTARALTGWSIDGPVLVAALCAAAAYVLAVRRVRARGGDWPRSATGWFVIGGLGTLVVVTCSFLGVYARVLFWPLAVQDVLLLSLVPVGLTLGRPIRLWRAWRGSSAGTDPGLVVRLLSFPLTGSVLAVALLLVVYTSGWDQARLEHRWLLEATRFLLVAAGCGFLWPLLGVDEGTGRTPYPVRALIAFLDGLLDALPGLAVLGTGHVIAAGYYAGVARDWGPSPARAQQIGGTAMVALSELAGLPTLLVLLVAWVRHDARQARDVDAALDVLGAAEVAAAAGFPERAAPDALLHRPWWEVDAGPLAERARRHGWGRDPDSPLSEEAGPADAAD